MSKAHHTLQRTIAIGDKNIIAPVSCELPPLSLRTIMRSPASRKANNRITAMTQGHDLGMQSKDSEDGREFRTWPHIKVPQQAFNETSLKDFVGTVRQTPWSAAVVVIERFSSGVPMHTVPKNEHSNLFTTFLHQRCDANCMHIQASRPAIFIGGTTGHIRAQ